MSTSPVTSTDQPKDGMYTVVANGPNMKKYPCIMFGTRQQLEDWATKHNLVIKGNTLEPQGRDQMSWREWEQWVCENAELFFTYYYDGNSAIDGFSISFKETGVPFGHYSY